jgi:hypothetical protein
LAENELSEEATVFSVWQILRTTGSDKPFNWQSWYVQPLSHRDRTKMEVRDLIAALARAAKSQQEVKPLVDKTLSISLESSKLLKTKINAEMIKTGR